MSESPLEKYLPRPVCEKCGTGTVRPVDIMSGKLVFDCSNRGACTFSLMVPLPRASKTRIYIDPQILSASTPHRELSDALRRASERNLVALPGTAPELRTRLAVKEAQLGRALDRWLRGEPAILDVDPPWQDAFESDPDEWHNAVRAVLNVRPMDDVAEAARRAADRSVPALSMLFENYCDERFSFAQIVALEKTALGKAVVFHGREVYAARAAFLRGEPIDTPLGPFSTTIDKLTVHIDHRLRCGSDEAFAKAIDFLTSEHAAEIPFSEVSARLQAGLALLCRGASRRAVRPEDAAEIEHASAFIPYVDVYVTTNRELAALANDDAVRAGERFGTKVQSLDAGEIPAFIDWLESLADGDEIARLSERIVESIRLGGVHRDFQSAMGADLEKKRRTRRK